ncbi:MAG: cupin domain-containing protein [Ignavibacteriota bacterium]
MGHHAERNARITAVDQNGKSLVSDVGAGDLWLFPPGVPHSIQGLGPDGCRFLLVFDDGNFDEFHTFLITDWLTHTSKEVLAKNFQYRKRPSITFRRRSSSFSRRLFPATCTPSRPRLRRDPGRCRRVSTSRRAP